MAMDKDSLKQQRENAKNEEEKKAHVNKEPVVHAFARKSLIASFTVRKWSDQETAEKPADVQTLE